MLKQGFVVDSHLEWNWVAGRNPSGNQCYDTGTGQLSA